ncbi:MAG: DUF6089 family protein [Bacteroidota bacterium]
MNAIRLLIPMLLLSFTTSAQNLEGGIFLGTSHYSGDLVPTQLPDFSQTGFAGGFFLRHHINPKLAVRTNLLVGSIAGDDNNFTERAFRGFNFKSTLMEASLNLEWSLLGKPRFNSDGSFHKGWSPYLFAGIGGNYTNPDVDYNTNDISQDLLARTQEDQTSLSSKFNVAFPIGGGLKFDLNEKLTFGVEAGLRPTMSDLLDGVSQSGNPDANDWYGFGGITLSGRFGKSKTPETITDADEDKPLDRDGDGVADFDDFCPTEAGKAAFNGCPDTDDDGIADKDDSCPDVAGVKEFAGCPDTDLDGVADKDDECPDLSGAIALNGCPDRDNDGIADKDDNCPDEMGVSGNSGCPEVIVETTTEAGSTEVMVEEAGEAPFTTNVSPGTTSTSTGGGQASYVVDNVVRDIEVVELLEEAMEQVKFDLSSVNIKTESYPILDRIASLMQIHPDYFLTIKGYTDNSGSYDVNQQLSMRRARRCFKYLANMGVSTRNMTFVGLGSDNPRATNETERGRRQNRRVEFEITRQ